MLNDTADAPGNTGSGAQFFRAAPLGRSRAARILSAIVLMAAALVSVWQGGLVFDLIWLGAALAVGCEWQNLIAAPNPRLRFLLVAVGLVA